MIELDYEDEEREDIINYRPAFNPDRENEKAIERELHGSKYKPWTRKQILAQEDKYDRWIESKSKKFKENV